MVGRFSGRQILGKASCPFCGMPIERPKELSTRMPNEMPVGRCSCGAVYACDVTGHNLGTAMIEALVFGCDGDWDLAWSLLPEEDYLERQVENYDHDTHLIVPHGAFGGRRIAGTLYFIRLHQDVREVTEEGVRRRLEKATPVSQPSSAGKRSRKSLSKKEVASLVSEYDLEPLLRLAEQDKRIIRHMKRLLYAADKLHRWRAADVLGRVSAIIAKEDPAAISKLLQGLITSIADTAASAWGSLDAIGEIISNCPEQFAAYTPQLYPFASDRALLEGVLRALGKIGGRRPDRLRQKAHQFIPLLQDPDPEIRGYAAILLGNLAAHEARDDLSRLVDDGASMEVFSDGRLEKQTVGQLASQALEKL